MRRVLLCLCCVVLLAACDGARGFVVEGTMTNAEDGDMVCLSYPIKHDGVWLEQRDTTYVDSGKFRFEGKVDGLLPAHLSMQNRDEVQLFLEPANIKFSAERSTLYDYSLSGLSVDDDLMEYHRAFELHNKAVMLIAFFGGIKNPRTEYAKAYDAGCFGHKMC